MDDHVFNYTYLTKENNKWKAKSSVPNKSMTSKSALDHRSNLIDPSIKDQIKEQ